jgi:hypothetical protein
MDVVKIVSKKVDSALKRNLNDTLVNAIEELKQIIIEEYDNKIMGVKIDRRSKIDYDKYRDKFISCLNNFQFVEDKGTIVTLNTPDMETFDFSDNLEIIRTMMEGLSGVYVEVDEKEYSYIFGRKPKLTDTVDKDVAVKDRVFLVRYTGNVKRAEKDLNKRFVRYPFSNIPPIDILEAGDIFVKDNLDVWINNSIERANKEVVKTYK